MKRRIALLLLAAMLCNVMLSCTSDVPAETTGESAQITETTALPPETTTMPPETTTVPPETTTAPKEEKMEILNWATTCDFAGKVKELTYDVPPFRLEEELYVQAKYTANLFGVHCMEKDGVYTGKSDSGRTLTFSEKEATLDGKVYPVRVVSGVIMVPAALFSDGDLGNVAVSDSEKTVTLTRGNGEIAYDAPPAAFIRYASTQNSVTFRIPHETGKAKIQVYYKDAAVNPAVNNSLAWCPVGEAVYNGKEYVGGIGALSTSRKYIFRLKVTEDGNTAVYDEMGGVMTLSKKDEATLKLGEFLYKTEGELKLVETYENIGYYIDDPEARTAAITYRKVGENTWQNAYQSVYDGIQHRGSIVRLEEDTEYEVKATLTASDGKSVTKTATVRTMSSAPKIAETISLSKLYSGEGGLVISGLRGSADGFIKVVNDTGLVIDASTNYMAALLVDNCSHVILEGFVLRGGYRYGVIVSDNSESIRICNFDISGWGRDGVLSDKDAVYHKDGTNINYDAGIYARAVRDLTIERCYIHNSRSTTNPWKTVKRTDSVHPQGSCAIYYSVIDRMIVRYNDFVGNSAHRFNDAIEGVGNGKRGGGAARNTDIYGNMFYMGEDDGMELDGGQMNARVYDNRIEQFLAGISTAPCMTGPNYIFSNLIVNLGTSYYKATPYAVKTGGSPEVSGEQYFGLQHYFSNTFDSGVRGLVNVNYGGSGEYHAVTRNNIFVSRGGSNRHGLQNKTANERDDMDYDLLGGPYQVKEGDESHGIVVKEPTYQNSSNGIYRLKAGSPGTAASVAVDNFCAAGVDVGVYGGRDANDFAPFRPVDMYASTYRIITTTGGREVTVTIGDIGEDIGYKILTDEDWVVVSQTSGVAKANSTITFTVKRNRALTSEHGMILFRLDNGYSIPISLETP